MQFPLEFTPFAGTFWCEGKEATVARHAYRLFVGVTFVLASASTPARAQLRPDEVLVVYDSRIADSLAVAEYYAGSASVPGGSGGVVAARPGVRTLDLASTGAAVAPGGNIAYADFASRLRDPIRAYLTSAGLTQRVRCLVTTKGLPHRILDTDVPLAGDNPSNLVAEYQANDATCAAVDAELALLWQSLNTGEAGGAADSKADGAVQNPFWKSAAPLFTFPQTNNTVAKSFSGSGGGPTWIPIGAVGSATRLGPGDLYLVCRLDGYTLADIRGMIDRAKDILYDTANHAVFFDESESDGVATAANTEFDNSNTAFPPLYDSDDYERTRDELAADTRFFPAFTRYNALLGRNQFFVGPRVSWFPGDGIMITSPVVLVATYGANHLGLPRDAGGTDVRTFYADSYNYPRGAIINTIESYNGRDFAGLGQISFAQQQQVAGFIAAGGTFAIGNVWEPLADTVGDNRYLSQNFVRGNMSWAEAAWSAIPGLSWQQMVLGDPLARPSRTSEDIDANGRVSVDDLYAWEKTPADVNRDSTVDAADRAHVLNALRSWERPDLLALRR